MITWIYQGFIVSSTRYNYIIYKVHCSWVYIYPSNKYKVFVISILFKKVVLYGSNTGVRPVS